MILCVCHTTPTQNDPVCSLLSGWATATGRLLDYKDTAMCFRIGVELRFATVLLLLYNTSFDITIFFRMNCYALCLSYHSNSERCSVCMPFVDYDR